MRRHVTLFGALALALLWTSCAGTPVVQPSPPPEPQAPMVVPQPPPPPPPPPPPAQDPIVKPAFDPASVTVEQKTATFIDIRTFIEGLNRIIQRKDYEAWLSNLTPEYISYYSDPALLAQMSEYPVLKRSGTRLTSLRDYFIYVVYPSRQNDRVDDIDFVGEFRVKAITVGAKGDRQILYNLEKHGETWKIGIGR